MLILGIDPGNTTGLCIVNRKGRSREFSIVRSGVVLWHRRLHFQNFLTKLKPHLEAIVIEEYRLFANPKTLKAQIGSEMPSAQMIGIVSLACENLNLTSKLVFQTPKDIHTKDFDTKKEAYTMSFNPGDRLRLRNSVDVKNVKHVEDAYQHCKFYIFTNREK